MKPDLDASETTRFVQAFHETCSLSDAVELIGRRLFAHEWTGLEYLKPQVISPEILGAKRSPLEEKLKGFASEHTAIQHAIDRSIDAKEIDQLKSRRANVETRWSALNAALTYDLPPLNDLTLSAHASTKRWMEAEGTLLSAIRERQLKVHDGRGREVSFSVWDHPHSAYSIELSIVVNSKRSGEPRRQAARIDRRALDVWLKTLKPIVEPTQQPSAEGKLRDYLERQVVLAAQGGGRKTKPEYRKEAMSEIPGISRNLFNRIWPSAVPKTWQKAGAPKRKSSRS